MDGITEVIARDLADWDLKDGFCLKRGAQKQREKERYVGTRKNLK